MKIEIEEGDKTISVKVKMQPLKGKSRTTQKRKIFYKDIVDHLVVQNIKVGRCLSAPPLVTNKMDQAQLSGEWIFEKIKPPPPKKVNLENKSTPAKKKSPRIRKKPKKVEKILDKSPEDVIIEVEKKETLTLSKTRTVTEE
jgi:hypothetical protein